MDGFSTGAAVTCASDGGAAFPLTFRCSMLGTTMPFCPGRDSGEPAEPTADDADEAGGEGRRFSVVRESRGEFTVAIVM